MDQTSFLTVCASIVGANDQMLVLLFLACAVSAMLCEVANSGIGSRVRTGSVDGEEVTSDMEFDVVLCQSELTEKALQLCHLLPPGFMTVSLNSYHTRTHTHTTQCVSFNGCLMELNSHSSCSAASISGRELSNCVCVCLSCVSVCGCVCTCFIRVTLRAPNQSQKCCFFLCLFTFDFSSCSFLSPLLAAMFSHPIPHTRNITPALIHLPAIFYSCPLISATSLLYTLCSVSAVCLDM